MEEIFYGDWDLVMEDPFLFLPIGIVFLDITRIRITGSDNCDNTYNWRKGGLSMRVTGKEWKVSFEGMVVYVPSGHLVWGRLSLLKKTVSVSANGIVKSLRPVMGIDIAFFHTFPCDFTSLNPDLKPPTPGGKSFDFTLPNNW